MMLTLKGKFTLRDSSSADLVHVAATSPYADVVLSLASREDILFRRAIVELA